MPGRYGSCTTVYNRFNRWRKAGIWDKLMAAILRARDGEVQMIDSSIVRVHQHASGAKKSGVRCVGRSRGGLTPKIHARVDAKGRPVRRLISSGNDHDVTAAEALFDGLEPRAIVIADKCRDTDSVRTYIRAQGAIPNIPNRGNRKRKYLWKKAVCRERSLPERFFNKLKQFPPIATRSDKFREDFIAFIQLVSSD